MINDTIFAQITGIGGAVTVVRISGKNCLDCLQLFNIYDSISIENNPSKIFVKNIYYKNELNSWLYLDECLIVYFKSPNSFTGEDILEISLHGSQFIVSKVIEILSNCKNFRLAKNGEFTKRALLNNKIDIIKSEGIYSMINANTSQQHRLATEIFAGDISNKYKKIREDTINILSIIETSIDFSDEDIPARIFDEVFLMSKKLENDLNQVLKNGNIIQKILDGINIVVFGAPNAGKSSFINKIVGRKVSIISDIPGTTRDAISSELEIEGYKVNIFDTAGLNANSNDIIELEGISIAKDIIKNADIKIAIIDSSEDLEFIINNIINNLNNCTSIDIIILNKIDRLIEADRLKLDVNLKDYFQKYTNNFIYISIKDDINIDTCRDKICSLVKQIMYLNSDCYIFNNRHKFLINSAANYLSKIDKTKPIELIAFDIKQVIANLSELIGDIYTDDVLDSIFSKFCIGK
jgi:tRNA modification GTPase